MTSLPWGWWPREKNDQGNERISEGRRQQRYASLIPSIIQVDTKVDVIFKSNI